MAHIVLDGGNRLQQDALIGELGELTFENQSPELRLHDNVNAGGLRILGLVANDLRYQGKDADLSALGDFTTEQGFLTRLGAGNYALRAIDVVSGELVVTNPLGAAGNVVLGLPSVINKAITFTAAIISSTSFTAPDFFGNLTGNVIGDVTGNVTGDLIGDVVGNLTGNVIGDISGKLTGSFNVSSGTITFATGQIPTSALAGNFISVGSELLFLRGMIIEWFGDAASVPAGWVICDGTNGTPDKRDRFGIGVSVSKPFGDTGGALTHEHGAINSSSAGGITPTITVDGHVLTEDELPSTQTGTGIGLSSGDSQIPIYGSQSATNANRSMSSDGDATLTEALTESFGDDDPHAHTASSSAIPNHLHSTTIPAIDHTPPYIALHFIMKT